MVSDWIEIKFKPYFKEPMLSGVKQYTSRSKVMGKPGDRFMAFGAEFELLSVADVDLYTVSTMWREEGCKSREHFIEVWNEIHPRKGYDDYQRTYLHHFRKVSP